MEGVNRDNIYNVVQHSLSLRILLLLIKGQNCKDVLPLLMQTLFAFFTMYKEVPNFWFRVLKKFVFNYICTHVCFCACLCT